MPIVLNGTTGITTPTYNGSTTAEYLVPVTGFKNRIINGDMTIDQRNAGASVTVTNAGPFTVDRFNANKDTSGATVTAQQSSTAPTGFVNSLLWTISTGSTAGVDDDNFIAQKIEGFNIADLGWGTANAQTITLSFWVRSSLTGTFGVSFRNSGGSRSYVASYTITAANTFEYKTVTVAGDTSGTWLTNNGLGIWVDWDLGCGTNRSRAAGSWQAGSFPGLTSGVKLVQTTGATFYITGVQLEKGSNATSFDYLPYGTELALCQRYFVRDLQDNGFATFLIGVCDSTTGADRCGMRFPVQMRAAPTAAYGGTANPRIYDGNTAPVITSINSNFSSSFGASLNLRASGGGLVLGRAAIIIDNNASFFTYSAEL